MTQPTQPPWTLDRLARPPGKLFNGVVLVSFLWAVIRGSERTGDLDTILPIAALWFCLLLAWLFRFAAAAGAGTVTSRTGLHWVVAPVLFGAAAVVVFGGYAMGVRFALSQSAFDAVAERAAAGEPFAPGWVGLYPVGSVAVEDQSVRVDVSDQYAFTRDAPPGDSMLYYEPVSGRWSIEVVWTGEFD
jgi:hypothetical protein